MSSLNLGRIYYYMGESQLAAVNLEDARKADDNNSDITLYLGRTYEAIGEYNYASNVYESYLARNSGDAVICNQFALCLMELGDYEKALEYINEGMAVGDMSVMQSLLFNEIVVYEYLGDFQSAYTLVKSYLKAYPGDEAALREQIFLQTR